MKKKNNVTKVTLPPPGHQGDVQYRYRQSLPSTAKLIERKPIALGEHSGHMHILTGDVEMYEENGTLYAVVGKDGASLQHVHQSNVTEAALASKEQIEVADHGPHTFEPGSVVEFWIQNNYNPYTKLMEEVKD